MWRDASPLEVNPVCAAVPHVSIFLSIVICQRRNPREGRGRQGRGAVAEGVAEGVPQDVAQELAFGARAARAFLASPPPPPPPSLCSSR